MARIKALSRNKFVVQLVRFFHLGFLFKFLHFRIFGPKNKIKPLRFENIQALFYATNYEDLNTLETILTEGMMDERPILAALLETLTEGDVALDVGAYHGLHSIFMAKKVGPRGTVIAIEPDPKNYETLQANIRLNDLPQIIPFQLALGDKNEDRSLYSSRRKSGASQSLVEITGSHFPQPVRVVTGDYLLQSQKLPAPKVIKIDVEGYEYPVLEGLKKTLAQKTTRLVNCEIHSHLHPEWVTPDLILGYLKRLDFSDIKTLARGGEIHAICVKPANRSSKAPATKRNRVRKIKIG
ncbi:MAG: FkbM family methyltransferase [Candidatus Aminicenantales bacterium]